MIDRRQFFRRLGGAALTVAIAPDEAFRLPELDVFRGVYGKPFIESLASTQAELNGLMHDVYCKAIVTNVRAHTPMLKAFADQPSYMMEGEKLVFPVDLKYHAQ